MPLPKQIFLDSLDLPADQRQAFIERHCADDASLLSRVRALLQAHQAAGGFLDQSPAITIDPSDDPRGSSASGEKIGDVVGRYSLIRKLGEGGFGIVYLAEQSEPVVRQVALKVIRAGMDSAQIVARFENERQALASRQSRPCAAERRATRRSFETSLRRPGGAQTRRQRKNRNDSAFAEPGEGNGNRNRADHIDSAQALKSSIADCGFEIESGIPNPQWA